MRVFINPFLSCVAHRQWLSVPPHPRSQHMVLSFSCKGLVAGSCKQTSWRFEVVGFISVKSCGLTWIKINPGPRSGGLESKHLNYSAATQDGKGLCVRRRRRCRYSPSSLLSVCSPVCLPVWELQCGCWGCVTSGRPLTSLSLSFLLGVLR